MPNARDGRVAHRCAGHLGRVRRRLVREALAEAGDVDRPVRAVARPRRRGHHERGAAGARHHDLEQVERRRDHARREHVVDGDRLAVEHGRRVGAGAHALVGRDLGACLARPSRRGRGSAARTSRSRSSAPRCRRARRTRPAANPTPCSTRRTRPAGSGPRGRGRRRTGSPDGRAHHHLADAQLDRRRGPPHHADGRRTAEIDALGEVHRPAAVLGDGRGEEQRRLGDVAGADEPVDGRGIDARVGESVGGEPGPLLDGERRGAVELALGGSLGDADDARVSPTTPCHAPPPSTAAARATSYVRPWERPPLGGHTVESGADVRRSRPKQPSAGGWRSALRGQ